MGNTQEIGKLGEDLACRFLMKHGYKILSRNYRKFYGEIDIVASKLGVVHFVEVKAVSYETGDYVSHETTLPMPEENIHPKKLERLAKTAQVYLMENKLEGDWQMDALAVFVDIASKRALFRHTEAIS